MNCKRGSKKTFYFVIHELVKRTEIPQKEAAIF